MYDPLLDTLPDSKYLLLKELSEANMITEYCVTMHFSPCTCPDFASTQINNFSSSNILSKAFHLCWLGRINLFILNLPPIHLMKKQRKLTHMNLLPCYLWLCRLIPRTTKFPLSLYRKLFHNISLSFCTKILSTKFFLRWKKQSCTLYHCLRKP